MNTNQLYKNRTKVIGLYGHQANQWHIIQLNQIEFVANGSTVNEARAYCNPYHAEVHSVKLDTPATKSNVTCTKCLKFFK